MIKLASPQIEEDDLRAVREVLISGMLVQGLHSEHFEKELAERVGTKHAVVVSSGTAALHLALLALGIGPGDSVVVPAFSWPATANVVTLSGADPVFVDIDPTTFVMDLTALEEALLAHPVKAIMPVHAFGAMAPMGELLDIARGVPVVEDAAGALGAELAGRSAGAWGVAGCFSFHPRKTITTGEGGAVVTDDDALARSVRALKNHGLRSGVADPEFEVPGFNLRMTDFQAALGRSQLAKLQRLLDSRAEQAAYYDESFRGSSVHPQSGPSDSRHAYQAYVCLVDGLSSDDRSAVIRFLHERHIEATIGTHHIPMTSWYRKAGGHHLGEFPVTDDVFARTIALPLHYALSREEQDQVVDAVLQALGEQRPQDQGSDWL